MLCFTKTKINIFIILLSCLIFFHALSNYYILTKSRYILGPDNLSFFNRTIQIFRAFKNVKLNLKSLYKTYTYIVISKGYLKAPLFFLTASPFLLFGIDKNIIIMSNLIYFAISLFATYGIARIYFNSKIVGFFSAFLFSMFPTVFAFSRVLIIDFALTGMVTLTAYLFLLNKFDSLKFSLLVGGIIGLGSLTKNTYFIFFLPVLLYFFFRNNNLKNKKILRNFISSIILGLLVAANFYLPNFYGNISYGRLNMFQVRLNPSHFYYLSTLLNRQLLPIYFLLFLLSLIFVFKKNHFFLYIMILVPLIIFSIFTSKVDRYILPIFPYIAIAICGFLGSLSKIKKTLFIILFLFGLFQYSIISYQNVLPIFRRLSQNSLFAIKQDFIEFCGLFSTIDEGDWENPSREIIYILSGDIRETERNINRRVLFISRTWKIFTTINYLQLIRGLSLDFYRALAEDYDFLYRPWYINKDFDNEISCSDFIVIEEMDPKDINIHSQHLLDAFKRNFYKFDFIKTIVFPNNLTCYVYKNKEIM